ncbi:MAG: hypothetical protein K0Q66_560 [Chitinophagaceae bacterium]|nr:hypothetical protein [Chitinophagaceae bacterium]
MTIEQFKDLSHPEKLKEIRYNGNLLGSYERPSEDGGRKTPGDIYEIHEFWVFLSEDEEMVIPTRKNPMPPEEEEEEEEEEQK